MSIRSFTIDLLSDETGSWHWKVYTVGGRVFVDDGEADSLEEASSAARTAMIVHHRTDP